MRIKYATLALLIFIILDKFLVVMRATKYFDLMRVKERESLELLRFPIFFILLFLLCSCKVQGRELLTRFL